MSLANKFGIPESLLDASKRMLEEANEYQKKVQAHMAKKGIKSLSDMTADQKKKFFNELDAMHTAKNEEVEQVEEGSGPKEKQKPPYRNINSPASRAAADKRREEMDKEEKSEKGKKLLDKIAAKNEEVEQVEEELKGEMHPDAHKVLKHIKPEHHGTYKPYLKKGTYKGDYNDRAAVLSAAEKAGHVKEEIEDDQEDIELTLEDLEFIMQSEDFHQLDELSKNTLKSYVKKAEKNWQAHNEKQHGLESARSMLNQLSAGAPGGGKQHVRGVLPGSGTVNTERGHVGDNLKKHMPDVHKQMVKIHKKLQADRIETKRVMNKRSEGIRGAEKRIRKMRPATYKNEQVELTQEDLDFIASLNQIDELSKDTVASYAGKAGRTLGGNIQALSKAKEIGKNSYPEKSADQVKKTLKKSIANRKAGLNRAEKRLSENEEFDLDDFTVEEIQEYMQTEEFAQLDELSKETLGSYIKKRQHDVAAQGAITRQHAVDAEKAKKDNNYSQQRKSNEKSDKAFARGWKYRQNISRAVDKIVKKA